LPVPALAGVSSVAAGHDHTCAITGDGRLHCWGDNRDGAVGDGTSDQAIRAPYHVRELRDVVQASAGAGFTCALTADGGVWCWGSNASAQLGQGPGDPRRSPSAEPVAYR
jgi:alpha-tubulin suppressor-like RCC1 family protein